MLLLGSSTQYRGAVWFVFCSSNNSSNFQKPECKFHDEGTSRVTQSSGCFARRVCALALQDTAKQRKEGGVCICIYMCAYIYISSSVCGGMWMPRCLGMLRHWPWSGAGEGAAGIC